MCVRAWREGGLGLLSCCLQRGKSKSVSGSVFTRLDFTFELAGRDRTEEERVNVMAWEAVGWIMYQVKSDQIRSNLKLHLPSTRLHVHFALSAHYLTQDKAAAPMVLTGRG
jgi:hypothetical protein